MAFNLGLIVKAGIKAISNAVNMFAPNEITLEQKASLQKIVGTTYAAAKNIGPDLVASTENDLDDALLMEVIEICEQAAAKYGLELDPTVVPI